MAEILLFDSVFHDGVIPVSVSTLKPLLEVNRGYTTETLSNSYSKNLYIRLVVVVATTCQNDTHSLLTSAKLSVSYLVVGITRNSIRSPCCIAPLFI